jgi:hypothetical protein
MSAESDWARLEVDIARLAFDRLTRERCAYLEMTGEMLDVQPTYNTIGE